MSGRLLAGCLALVGLVGCSPAGPAPPAGGAGARAAGGAEAAAADSWGSRFELPAGAVLRHWLSGGIAGFGHDLVVDGDGMLELKVLNRPGARLPLDPKERGRLEALLADARPIEHRASDPPEVADGMAVGLLFAGRGTRDLDDAVRALAGELLALADNLTTIAGHPLVVAGRVEASDERTYRLRVDRLLAAADGAGVEPGALLHLEGLDPRQDLSGLRIWGLFPSPREPDRMVGWQHAPPELEPRILLAIEQRR